MLIESVTPCHDAQRCRWDLNPIPLTALAAKSVNYNAVPQHLQLGKGTRIKIQPELGSKQNCRYSFLLKRMSDIGMITFTRSDSCCTGPLGTVQSIAE